MCLVSWGSSLEKMGMYVIKAARGVIYEMLAEQ